MYRFDFAPLRAFGQAAPVSLRRVSRTVWLLGFTSLFTDISSEMVAAILPGYLVGYLGLPPWAFGAVTGLYDGLTAFVRPVAGKLADRFHRTKLIAFVGYATSAVCKLLWPAVGASPAGIVAVIAIDRAGKGIRTAPRDAMIAASSPSNALGIAFGVHRALDAVGALGGPLVALAVLRLVPGGFDAIFTTSFFIALIGLGMLVLLVEEPGARGQRTVSSDDEAASNWRSLRDPAFMRVASAVFVLGCASVNDPLLYLTFQQRTGFNTVAIPSLYFGTALTFLVLATPLGALGDRVGRRVVFIAGHLALALVYAALWIGGPSAVLAPVVVILLGMYYASTDGMIAAIAGGRLKAGSLGTGLGTLSATISVARLIGAVLFGWIWSAAGVTFAIACAGGALIVAIVAAGFLIGEKVP